MLFSTTFRCIQAVPALMADPVLCDVKVLLRGLHLDGVARLRAIHDLAAQAR